MFSPTFGRQGMSPHVRSSIRRSEAPNLAQLSRRSFMRADTIALPILTAERGVIHYLEEIKRFPMLESQEEYMLAKRRREHSDQDAAHRLLTSHLRLVAKIARRYRGYGLPISEMISEGNFGLLQAVKRFEPDKGFRLSTLRMWWVK